MIEIELAPWEAIVLHAERTYPNEGCGVMLGRQQDGKKIVTEALPVENSFPGEQSKRYELRPEDLLTAEKIARERGLDLIGIFHSHPDCDAYFSEMDLENSCPWYSFVVVSIRNGKFDHANSYLPNDDRTRAEHEELICQKS